MMAPYPRHVQEGMGCTIVGWRHAGMTQEEYARKLDELDRLLNDPDVPIQPARIWSLLAEISQRDAGISSCAEAEASLSAHASTVLQGKSLGSNPMGPVV